MPAQLYHIWWPIMWLRASSWTWIATGVSSRFAMPTIAIRQLDITIPRYTVRNTVTRPPQPLRVADPLLSRRRLRPAIPSAAMPAATPARAITWNDSREKA